MSDSVWPHRWQPTRLPHPWDSPGKNTGVGCHFLLQCMKVKSESDVTQSCLTLRDSMDCSPPGSSVCGIFQARVLVSAIWQCKSAISVYIYVSFLLSLLIPIILSCIFTKGQLWLFQSFLSWFQLFSDQLLSHVQLLATPWTAAYQAPSFIGFSRQEKWSGVPLPSLILVVICC